MEIPVTSPDVSKLTPEDFEPLVGQSVQVQVHDVSVTLILKSCTRHSRLKHADFREPFSLVLVAADGQATIEQGTWDFEFGPWGTFSAFMVPVAPAKHEITFS